LEEHPAAASRPDIQRGTMTTRLKLQLHRSGQTKIGASFFLKMLSDHHIPPLFLCPVVLLFDTYKLNQTDTNSICMSYEIAIKNTPFSHPKKYKVWQRGILDM
jgi:hypothetical protein